MQREAIEQELEKAGWALDYGFSGHLIIGNSGDLYILFPYHMWQGANPQYELYDAQRNVACRVGSIPTPLRAGMLLEEHGEDAFADEHEGWLTSSTNYY